MMLYKMTSSKGGNMVADARCLLCNHGLVGTHGDVGALVRALCFFGFVAWGWLACLIAFGLEWLACALFAACPGVLVRFAWFA